MTFDWNSGQRLTKATLHPPHREHYGNGVELRTSGAAQFSYGDHSVVRADQSREEQKRQGAVAASAIMDTPREAAFDSIVFTAAQLFRVPMAMLAIVSEDRVWLKASVGPLPHESSIKEQFCATVVDTDEVLVVEDTTTDRRFAQFPIVAGAPGVRFYAGVPLHGPGNIPIATLCVLDRHPRTVPDRARSQLMQLAREAEELLRLRIAIPAPPN